jgi:hypothetical protein
MTMAKDEMGGGMRNVYTFFVVIIEEERPLKRHNSG